MIVDSLTSAVRYGHDRGWQRIAAGRYATPEKDDIRVIERLAEIFPVGGVISMIRGPGFNENLQAQDFEKLVEEGQARWTDE